MELYYKIYIYASIFGISSIGSCTGVTISVKDDICANENSPFDMNCTIEDLTLSRVDWFFNGVSVTTECLVLDDRVDLTLCDLNGADGYYNLRILNFTDSSKGTWSCEHGGAAWNKTFDDGPDGYVCRSDTQPQPSQKTNPCYLSFGSCKAEIKLSPFCAYPEPEIKLLKNGEDVSHLLVVDANPDITCSYVDDYKMSATVKMHVPSNQIDSYIFEVSYVQYPERVFHRVEIFVEHQFCVWCLILFLALVAGTFTTGVVVYVRMCKKPSETNELPKAPQNNPKQSNVKPTKGSGIQENTGYLGSNSSIPNDANRQEVTKNKMVSNL